MKLLSIAAASLALLASPVLAQNSTTNWSNGSYDVTGSSVGEDPACIMTSTFEIEGRSDVKFYLVWDGETALFSLASSGWSADKDREYNDFGYYFPKSDSLFNGGVTSGILLDYIYKGFLTSFDSSFLDKLASEDRLFVARDGPEDDDVTVVARPEPDRHGNRRRRSASLRHLRQQPRGGAHPSRATQRLHRARSLQELIDSFADTVILTIEY